MTTSFSHLCLLLLVATSSHAFAPSSGRTTRTSVVVHGAAEDFFGQLQRDFDELKDTISSAIFEKTEVKEFAENLVGKVVEMTGATGTQRPEKPEAEMEEPKQTAEKDEEEQLAGIVESMETDYEDLKRMQAEFKAYNQDALHQAQVDQLEQHSRSTNYPTQNYLEQLDSVTKQQDLQKMLDQIRELPVLDVFGHFTSTPQQLVENLQEQFNQMQKDVVANKDQVKDLTSVMLEANIEDLTERMLETAIYMTGAQRDLETEHMAAAETKLQMAMGTEKQAQDLIAQGHMDAMASETEESNHVKEDAKKLFFQAKATQRLAREEKAEAERTLKQLERNESQLKTALQQLRTLKQDK